MNEPTQTPPPPPPIAGAQQKKGGGALKWILIGCLGLILLSGALFFACSVFVAKKAKDFAGEISENPAGTLARMAVKANPDLEVVEDDPEAGTLTIRNKETGEQLTVDYDEISQGKLTFETPEGKVDFDATRGEVGIVRIQDEEGNETVLGAGAEADVPDWVPAYSDGTAPETTYSRRGDGGRAGAFTFETTDSISRVVRFYEEALGEAGFQVTVHSAPNGGLVVGTADAGRSVQVTAASEDDGTTRVSVNFSEGE